MYQKLKAFVSGDGYQARALRSTAMTILSIGGSNGLRLAANLVLTRLLFPEAFGMMALVMVVIAGANMFSDFGFHGSVIQDPRGDEPDFLNTAWTLQIIRGALLAVIIMIAAHPAAEFYDEPLLAELLLVAACIPLLRGLESTRALTANRTLQLERLTLISLSAQLLGAIATILLAWWLQSVWALVIGSLVHPIVQVAASHTLLKGHPNRLFIERRSFVSLAKFGGFIFIASIAGFFAQHGDRAVLGKYVELEDLAIYTIALMLASLPGRFAHAIAQRVIFPLYARRPPAESDNNRNKINKARRLVTAPLLFAAAAFAIVGDFVVRLLYDVRYEAAGPYLILTSLAIMPTIILQSYYRLPLASGHSGRFAVYQIVTAAVRLGFLLLLVPLYGLLGAILVPPLAALLLYVPLLILIRPYKSWDPLHDAVAFGATGALTVVVLWWNIDVVAPVFAAFP